jgi:hypothetical protein
VAISYRSGGGFCYRHDYPDTHAKKEKSFTGAAVDADQ